MKPVAFLKHIMLDSHQSLVHVTEAEDICTVTNHHGRSFKCPWPSAHRSISSELRHWPFEKRTPIIDADKHKLKIRICFLILQLDAILTIVYRMQPLRWSDLLSLGRSEVDPPAPPAPPPIAQVSSANIFQKLQKLIK